MASEPSWNKISAIFDQALEHSGEERTQWIAEACRGDAALLGEVEKMLAAHDRAGGVLDMPLGGLASEALHAAQEPVSDSEHVGPYRIVSEIGRGGMGVVYKAEDPRLGRFVALKFLPPHLVANERAKQRFLAEARAASALDHPNICTIHDIGRTAGGRMFFAMAYYDGQTLGDRVRQGPLPIEEAFRIGLEVARGLAHAHEAGVIHRDIKPANILLTTKGLVKILDFGLAKRDLGPVSDPNTRVGTVAYMSPEQASGAEVDTRTDLWALGATLYEMIIGRPPFRGEYSEAIIYAILNEEPERITGLRTGVPVEVERIVFKALTKPAAERYQHADELGVDLERGLRSAKSGLSSLSAFTGRVPAGPSIAVFPLLNVNRDDESEFFADGITEDITSALTKVPGLRVAAYNSALQFKGTSPELQEVGRRLGVENVLVGSVRRAGKQVRITVRLSNIASGRDVWSERYDRILEDVFEVQDEISQAVARRLTEQVGPPDEMGESPLDTTPASERSTIRSGVPTTAVRTAAPSTGGRAGRELEIRYCTRPDGVGLAYSVIGSGPALLMPPGWISHLQEAWLDDRRREFYGRLAQSHTLVLYDKHGTGLSDRDRTDFSLEAELIDLRTVIDHLALERVALVGLSQGGSVAIAYAVECPERVSHLVLVGAYAHGEGIADAGVRNSMLAVVRDNWGLGSKALADIFMPGADARAAEDFARLQRTSADAATACRLLKLVYDIDVRELLPQVRTPTLVLHREGDRAIPQRLAVEIARSVPRARLVSLSGQSHFPWLEDTDAILTNVHEFLAESIGPFRAPTGELSAEGREAEARPDVPIRGFPTYLDSFVGRETESRELERLLDTTRLLTLTGPGGTGKTRLGQAVGRAAAGQFGEGACFVGLAGVSDSAGVAPAIARALDLPDVAGVPLLANLKEYLSSKSMLLVVDNFEHVLEARGVVNGLLESCPAIKLLATSRAALRLTGEKEYPVPPLQVPRGAGSISAEAAARLSALKLFVERARAARPEFALSDSNAGDVGELCRRLDGLPLAIELAAARIKLFTPGDLVSRLAGRLDLLRGGTQDKPQRHRALRETIAWSFDLLEEPARRFFRRMAVFSGGLTLQAAEAVCADDAELRDGVLDWLGALAEQSLLVRSEDGGSGVRFLMLETIRTFALECLRTAGEEEQLRRAHAQYFLSLAEEAEPELIGAHQRSWLNRLEADRDNLQSALRWTDEHREDALGVRLGSSLWRFWIARGHIQEGLPVLERLLSRPSPDTDAETRIRALHGLGTLSHYLGETPKAREILKQCVTLARDRGDQRGMARALNNLAWVHSELSEFGPARALSREALILNEQLGEKREMALSLNNMGWVAGYVGDYPRAARYHQRSLDLRREIGDQRGIGFALTNLCWAECLHCDLDRASELIGQAVGFLEPLDDRILLSWATVNHARIARLRGDEPGAVRLLEEGIGLWHRGGHPTLLAWMQTNLGAALVAEGEVQKGLETLAHGFKSVLVQPERESERSALV